MEIARKTHLSRILSLAIGMMLSAAFFASVPAVFVHAETEIKNPVIDEKEITTWDCIWFGHYLQSKDGENGFKNEPIKWRVLSVDGNDAFLISDQILDAVPFNEDRGVAYDYCLWEKSTIRSWLNGYDASFNKNGVDYTENNFISRAFSAKEQQAILVTNVRNDKEIEYPHVEEDKIRENTLDRIYLADISEVTNPIYGFSVEDAATFTRTVTNTAYAAAGGTSKTTRMQDEGEKNSWLLRSPGEYSYYCDFLCADGSYDDYLVDGNLISSDDHGIRPVLHLDLSQTEVWSYAGQIRSLKEQKITVNASYLKTFGDPAFSLNAKTSGDGQLSYESSDETVLHVDSKGTITLVGAGSAQIVVTAAESKEYSKTVRVVTVVVQKKNPVLESPNLTKTYGNVPFTLKVQTDSDAKVCYQSSAPDILSVSTSGKVTIRKAGTAKITLSTAETDHCKAASAVITIKVSPAKQTITAKNVLKTYGSKAFSLAAKTNGKGTLTYKSSNVKVAAVNKNGKVTLKAPGVAKITITAAATANYLKATKTITIKVAPKKAGISKVTSSKAGSAVVSWKKDASVTGYQITYSTSSKFTNAKTTTISDKATVQKTINSLKSKKTYYVKVRAYVKSGSSTVFGAYSTVKQVKIK